MQLATRTVIPFGERIRDLLQQLQPPRKPAWLAKQSGLSASAISRLLRGERNPTMATVQCLAPVLGLKVEELLQGTDAEERLGEPSRFVLREHYNQVVRKLVEYESATSQARMQLQGVRLSLEEAHESRRAAQKNQRLVQQELDTARKSQREAERQGAQLLRDLRRHRAALRKAVDEVKSLRIQVDELTQLVRQTRSSTNISKFLAGVGAATGVFTVASLLRESADNEEADYFYDDEDD